MVKKGILTITGLPKAYIFQLVKLLHKMNNVNFHCAHCTCDTFCQNNVSSLVTLNVLFISRKKLVELQIELVSVNHCRMLNLTAETTFFA